MTTVNRIDRGSTRGVVRTPQGYLRLDCTATRAGVFEYRNPDGSIRRELRHPDDVFHADSLSTLASLPVTDEHPPELLNAENTKLYQRGHTADQALRDGIFISTAATITDADLIGKVERARAREVSMGYSCVIEDEAGEYEGERYDVRQRNIVYNHLAVVPRGRAGSQVRLRYDAAEQVQHTQEEEGKKPMPNITIDGVTYEASAELATAVTGKFKADAAEIQRLGGEVTQAKADATAAASDKDKLQANLDTTQAKLDAAEEKLKERTDGDDIQVRVDARLGLQAEAGPILGPEFKFDGLSDRAVKEAVIKELLPKVVLDGKSDDYIAAAYDSALEMAAERVDSTGDLRRTVAEAKKAGERADAQTARNDMLKRNAESWQQPLSASKEGK